MSQTSKRNAAAPREEEPNERRVPVAWEALEDAFENNAPEVHSYLQLEGGEVIRIVDGIADPAMHARVAADEGYLRIDPVSSREQYRWMERFIETVDESELRERLNHAIDGKGAFRRFKDVLMSYPVERERWFAFRSERLRSCMEAWLETHGIEPVERPQWRVPTAEDVLGPEPPAAPPRKSAKAKASEAQRARLLELVETLPVRELDAALAFLEFLQERKHLPRTRAKEAGGKDPAGKDPTGGNASDEDDPPISAGEKKAARSGAEGGASAAGRTEPRASAAEDGA